MEQKSGLIGIYEKANAATRSGTTDCPWAAENELFDPDYDRIMPWLENAMERMPVLAELGSSASSTARSPTRRTATCCSARRACGTSGCCCGSQVGIAWGPGCRQVSGAAGWSTARPTFRCASFDPRRFGALCDDAYRIDQGQGRLPAAPRDPVPASQPTCRPPGEDLAVLRTAEGQGRGPRRDLWLGTPALVRRRRR
jgi:dimethylglycine dehydrogenase